MQSLVPLVSVITPLFRAADTLPAALNSLIRQDDRRWESIIVDDGSGDDSVQLARKFAGDDQRFRVLQQPNLGACAARNTGLGIARGRYVLFLDADDWLEPTALSSMTRACDRKHLSAVHGGFRYAKPDGTLTQWTGAYSGGTPLFDALASSNVLSLPSCVMLRRSLLDEIGGGFDTSLKHCGDWDLWARVARADCKVGTVEDCVTSYRMRPASLSRNPLTLLKDATTVLHRIHGRDGRVARPQRRYASGADRNDFDLRLAGFTFYAAAFAAMQGRPEHANVLLDTIENWPSIPPRRIAEFLLHAACFSRCVAPDDLHPLPDDISQAIREMVANLESRRHTPLLSEQVSLALKDMGMTRVNDSERMQNLARLQRPRSADDTLASEFLRGLAFQECAA